MLTNWYIRRSRDRFWGDDTEAFDTLYTVLDVVCRVTAPLLPLTTEEIWRGLTGGRSVHLADWPSADDLPADDALVAAMDAVRDVCSSTSALRKAAGLRNRLPLASLTVVVDDAAALGRLRGRSSPTRSTSRRSGCSTADAPEAASYGVSQRLTVNARAAGPRLGKDVQKAIKGSKSGDWSVAEDGTVTAGGLELSRASTPSRPWPARPAGDSAVGVLPARRVRRPRHRRHARAGRRGPGPRPGPRGPAGPPRRRPRRLRPDRAHHRPARPPCSPPPAPTRSWSRGDPGDVGRTPTAARSRWR